MVEKQKMHEAYTFLNKKGKMYVMQFASSEEKEHFDGILYEKGIPLITVIEKFYLNSLVAMAH